MPTLGEMKNELEELKAQRVKPFEELEKKQKEIEQRFVSLIKTYCPDAPLELGIYPCLYPCLESYRDGSIKICALDENKKEVFGTDVRIYIRRNYRLDDKPVEKPFIIELSTGTWGSFGVDDADQITRYLVMGRICANFKTIEETIVQGLIELKPYREAGREIWRKVDQLECDIRHEEARLERIEFEKTIDYTKIYEPDSGKTKRDYFEREDYMRFDHNTENYTYIQVGYIRIDNGQFKAVKTKRFYKGAFVDFVKSGKLKVAQTV